ncbi:MAG: HEAT repeat domain-containing protein [Salinivenus sp.]
MWTGLSFPFEALSPASGLVATLILVSGGLLLLSVGLVAFALGTRAWSWYRRRVWRQRKKRWEAEVVKVLGGDISPRSLTDRIQVGHFGPFLEVLIPYATSVKGPEKRLIHALADPFLHKVRANLSSRRALIRAQAVHRLGLLGGAEQTDPLRDMLDDPSDRVVERAFHALARVGGPGNTERLLGCLTRLDHVAPRHISSSLARLGEGAAPTLRTAMAEEDRADFVRVCCAEALRELGDTAAVAAAAFLLDDVNFRVMCKTPDLTVALLRLLMQLGKGVHGPLVRAYCHAEDPTLRLHAARALGQLGSPEDEILLGTLVHADESRWVAVSAARSLIKLGAATPLRKLRTLDHPRAQLASDLILPSDQ